jgi:hypothetical protein
MESGFRRDRLAGRGAGGCRPPGDATTSRTSSPAQDPESVDGDIEVGVLYLRHLLQTFDGNERLALAGWYQGERAVQKHGLFGVTKPFVANVLALRSRM